MQASWIWIGAAILVAGLVAVSAIRHPILGRMAVRNAARRGRQTATVIAGLMVGTAIISAALVAGDSAGYAIRGYVYQSLGHIDESVGISAYSYFPEEAYFHLADDEKVQGATDGIMAMAVWEAAARSDAGLYEPSVFVIGYDTQASGFGTFHITQGDILPDGSDLRAGHAIISDHAAEALQAVPGDRLELRFTPPVDPFLPEFVIVEGQVAGTTPDTAPLPDQVPPVPWPPAPLPPVLAESDPTRMHHAFGVEDGAKGITLAVGSDPRLVPVPDPTAGLPPSLLNITLVDPDGTARAAVQGSSPLWLNLTTQPLEELVAGEWTMVVRAATSTGTAYAGAIAVSYPVYDLAQLRERARALQEQADAFGGALDDLGYAPPQTAHVTVQAVSEGGRSDAFDFQDVLYLPLADMQQIFGRPGQVNYIAFSNPGGPEEGAAGTMAAVQAINASLSDLRARYPVPSIEALEVTPEKETFLEEADAAGSTLTGLLVFAGSLSIITGLLLILNIFTMLAEERRSELGMARAIGMGRRDLVRLFLYEGSLYAVAAALVGSVVGLGLAYGMIWIMNAVIAQIGAELSVPPVAFRPTWEAVGIAFATGVLLTFATIWMASHRQSGLNVVRAIRRIEEPERAGSWRNALIYGPAAAIVGAVATLVGWWPGVAFVGRFSLQVFGPLLVALGAAMLLRPLLRRRTLYPLVATSVLAYYTATMFVITDFDDITEANLVGPVRGVLMTLAVVVLLVYFERGTRLLGRGLARLPALRAISVPAVSYPLHRKFRTGMTLAMFALVILSIGFFSIFGALFDTDPEHQTGGFDIEARTTLSVASLDAYGTGAERDLPIEVRHDLLDFATEDPGFITVEGGRTGRFGDFMHHVYGYDDAFAQDNGFRLLWRDERFATDAAAYQAVRDSDDLVIVSYIYSTDEQNQDLAYKVGDTLRMALGSTGLEYTIVGIQEQYHHRAIWLPAETVRSLFPTVEGLYLYRLQDGTDPAAAAQVLEQAYQELGMDAQDARAEVLREQASFRNILSAMKLFLALGLIVGVLSLGIVTSRSVLERRQEIGMLRALGLSGSQIRRMFFVEVTYTLVLGAAAGIACAILVTYGLWYAVIRDLQYPYVIPWAEIGMLVAAAYIVALMATAAPIRRSAKVPPAEALRYVE